MPFTLLLKKRFYFDNWLEKQLWFSNYSSNSCCWKAFISINFRDPPEQCNSRWAFFRRADRFVILFHISIILASYFQHFSPCKLRHSVLPHLCLAFSLHKANFIEIWYCSQSRSVEQTKQPNVTWNETNASSQTYEVYSVRQNSCILFCTNKRHQGIIWNVRCVRCIVVVLSTEKQCTISSLFAVMLLTVEASPYFNIFAK